MIRLTPQSAQFRTSSNWFKNGDLYAHQEYQVKIETWSDYRDGSGMSGWKARIAAHLPATTTFSGRVRTINPLQLSGSVHYPKTPESSQQLWDTVLSGSVPFQGYPDTPASLDYTTADVTARQIFLAKYRSRRTTFQSGVFFGELAETIHMLANPARALREGINSYYSTAKKRLKKEKHSRSKAKVLADTWLEYSYGWGPLVGDVADAARLLTADPYKVFQPIDASATSQWSTNPSESLYNTHLFTWRVRSRLNNNVEVRYIGAIGAENEPPSFPEQLGLSWSNLLPTVWELIPYSFLVDYFSNVGAIIAGASSGVVKLAWGNKTVRRQSVRHVECFFRRSEQLSAPKTASFSLTGDGPQSTYKDVDRVTADNVSVGITDVRFQLPPFASKKWLNIAALAHMRV